eukprot:4009259-Amphidinium_carterae.1
MKVPSTLPFLKFSQHVIARMSASKTWLKSWVQLVDIAVSMHLKLALGKQAYVKAINSLDLDQGRQGMWHCHKS